MYYQPVDEMSLRHLFSYSYAEEILKMSYLGPVLNESGNIETSPDCLILDRRERPWRILRCEFKYSPSSKNDFAQNGMFDMAIVWSIDPPLTKEKLREELLVQNGCQEICVLSDNKAFFNLDKYRLPDVKELDKIDELKNVILERKYPTVCAAFIAAIIYPGVFEMDRMVNALSNRFPEVKKMLPQGRANIVSALQQTKPPLIRWMHGNVYRWNDDINANIALKEIEHVIRTRFRKGIPSSDFIDSVKEGN